MHYHIPAPYRHAPCTLPELHVVATIAIARRAIFFQFLVGIIEPKQFSMLSDEI